MAFILGNNVANSPIRQKNDTIITGSSLGPYPGNVNIHSVSPRRTYQTMEKLAKAGVKFDQYYGIEHLK